MAAKLEPARRHPNQVLLGSSAAPPILPVCDHYSGVEQRMRKSLQLQNDMRLEFGACVFDVTLDCEDGAPVGGEIEHAQLVVSLVLGANPGARVGVRVHPVEHPSFNHDIDIIVAPASGRLSHLMLPKVESVADVSRAVAALDAVGANRLPLQVLIESPAAVQQAFDIAAHPRVQSISFGLMDFVSAHGGAIPSDAMSLQGQFCHPLVVRAKLEIASACHAHGKVPSHCIVAEYADATAIEYAARRAGRELGFTRMWSIHPAQIRPILNALSPPESDIETACAIILAAQAADWGPISHKGQLQDRASYRFYWHLLQRAHATGRSLPAEVAEYF